MYNKQNIEIRKLDTEPITINNLVFSITSILKFYTGISKMSASIEDIVRSNSEGLQGLFMKFKDYLNLNNDQQMILKYTADSKITGRQELVAKLVSTCLGLAVSFTITYFGFKYLANVLDPTRQEKKEAQKRVFKDFRLFVFTHNSCHQSR